MKNNTVTSENLNEVDTSTKTTKTTMSTAYVAKIGLLASLSAIAMIFQIPLWFAPSFYQVDLSDTIVLIGGFALNPIAVVYIQMVKIFLNLLFDGTATGGVGELANFIMGVSLAFPAAYIYHKNKSIKSAVIGLAVGTVGICITGALLNCYLLLPVYAKVFGMPIDSLVAMGTAVNPNITSLTQFILLAVVPFNIIKAVLNSIVTIMLYKKLSTVLMLK